MTPHLKEERGERKPLGGDNLAAPAPYAPNANRPPPGTTARAVKIGPLKYRAAANLLPGMPAR